nr:class D sortase [Anaerolineae bacterium]
MRDRRSVDDLTIEELEQILRLKKREQRLGRLRHLENSGRRLAVPPAETANPVIETEENPADSLSFESFVHSQRAGGRLKRKKQDRVLLAVELAAAAGLVAVLVFAALNLRSLNRFSEQAQADQLADIPAASATPLLGMVVLPGGHTPPTDPGGAQPNYNEVPAHLRPLVEQQFAGPIIVPTPGPNHAIRLRIPAINVDAPIVQGDGWEQLQKGVGQHIGSALPGSSGNLVLSAHNDIYGEIFRYLDELRAGDEVFVETQRQVFTYEVLYWRIVSPTEVNVIAQTREPVLTMISCYPYRIDINRIVVVAELKQ